MMTWTVELLNEEVKAEIQALPLDMQARFARIVSLIEACGLQNVHEPHIKHVQDAIWEMRMTGRDGISRALYVTASGQRVIVVRAFIKKTQKTPRREISLALQRINRDTAMKKRLFASELHQEKYENDSEYAREYDAMEEEFAIASAVIEARTHAKLTQKELAKKMGTSQAQIARMESGKLPSIRTLEKLAIATGTNLKVSFEPTNSNR